jgi:hypothetical protein
MRIWKKLNIINLVNQQTSKITKNERKTKNYSNKPGRKKNRKL